METDGRQYVTFNLDDELYAVDTRVVREIIELTRLTRVPQLPSFFRGVINLRGSIIPVLDLKMRFWGGGSEYRRHTCIIVTEIVTELSERLVGLVVDGVSDVVMLREESVAETPSFGGRVDTRFIAGMGKAGDDLLIILDMERILSEDENALIEETQRQMTEDTDTGGTYDAVG